MLILLFALSIAIGTPVFADHINDEQIVSDVARDEIRPLNQPQYDAVSDTTWLEAEDWVIGFEHDGDARAFPIKIMNWHEIVNDTIGGLDVAVTYCPLCRSAIVFDRNLDQAALSEQAKGLLPDGTILSFGNTGALYESDLVMYDAQTDSDWHQVSGEALRGPLHGTRLKRLAVWMMRWNQWQTLYPEGKVLSRDTGFPPQGYDQDSYEALNHYERTKAPSFSVSSIDDRTDPRATVLGLSFDGISKAYEIDILNDEAYADQVGDQPVVLFVRDRAAVAYSPIVENAWFNFTYRDGKFFDAQTNSTWDFSGKAVAGKLKGWQLQALPQTHAFWFSWALAQPETTLISDGSMMTPYLTASSRPRWGLGGMVLSFLVIMVALFLSLRFIVEKTKQLEAVKQEMRDKHDTQDV